MNQDAIDKYLSDSKPESLEKDLNLMIDMREEIKALVESGTRQQIFYKPFFISPEKETSAELWEKLKSSINQKSLRAAMLYNMVDGDRFGKVQFGEITSAVNPISNWDIIVTTDASDYYNIDYSDVITALDKTIGFIYHSSNFDKKMSAKFKETAGTIYKAGEDFLSSIIAKTIIQASQ